jgi:hypothetical protein
VAETWTAFSGLTVVSMKLILPPTGAIIQYCLQDPTVSTSNPVRLWACSSTQGWHTFWFVMGREFHQKPSADRKDHVMPHE